MTPVSTLARAIRIVGLTMASLLALTSGAASTARAQWVTTHEQFYLQAPHNWEFRRHYQPADRLFNAFDFGHAILYETLWSKPNAPTSLLEETWYDRLTKEILVRPPRVPLEEAAIEIAYARLAPEAKQMFDWAHVLHRQVYDVWADESLPDARKDAEVKRLVGYYKTRRDLAFSSKPKSMVLMQEQPYSLAFRKEYPKFNGLIWAYHWLQIGLYEPLIVNTTPETRQAGVRATVARFWQMLESPTATMPYVMPMTAAVAPGFAKRYPDVAIIFDNLHSMHDVISDILANDSVPRNRKRAEIMRAARLFRDDTSFVMTEQAWRTMAQHMGVENMGGPAVNFLPEFPAKTVTYGAVMTHDERTGEMTGFTYGQATGGAHAAHGAQPGDSSKVAVPIDHSKMHGPDSAQRADSTHEHMMELYMRMLSDSVIRQRVLGDTALRRLMTEAVDRMPAEHREHMQELLREPPPAAARTPTQPAAKPRSTPRRTPAPSAKPADPHAGHGTPPPKRTPKPAAAKPPAGGR